VQPASSGAPTLLATAAHRARIARELAALDGPPSLTIGYRRLASLIAAEANLLRRLVRFGGTGNDKGVLMVERGLRRTGVPKQALAVGLASCA
jgi:hypothetical protein